MNLFKNEISRKEITQTSNYIRVKFHMDEPSQGRISREKITQGWNFAWKFSGKQLREEKIKLYLITNF